MSPAPKSKTKDKSAVKATEQQKAITKLLAAPANGASSAYNPVSGTFYALETAPPSFPNSPDDQSGSSNGTPEYDSMSNNGSCSGESEDQKDKGAATARLEPVPGADADKREKTRQKNERKHQRQKERRARELHERCSRCLMSRKLLALSQQLVAMGFPSDRATAALLVNGGRLEESVAWLFEGGEEEEEEEEEEEQPAKIDGESNLKIDIGSELAKIAEMEIRFKCSRQDVERAVISCEGDIEKAAATLIRDQKQDPPSRTMSHPSGELSTPSGAVFSPQAAVARTPQAKPVSSAQLKRDERDFNYTKAVAAAAVTGTSPPDSGGNRSSQPARRPQPRGDWTRLQEAAAADKRWPNASSGSSISHAMTSPLQVAAPPAVAAARYAAIGAEAKTSLPSMGTLREPVIVMQRPQSNARQTTSVVGLTVPPAATSGWSSTGEMMMMMTTTMKPPTGVLGPNMQGMNPISALHYHHQNHYQPLVSSSVDAHPAAAGLGGRWNPGPSSLGAASPSSSSLAVPSSLGLFTGWGSSGSSGSSSPVDWTSTGSLMMQCDYASIDWSLDSTATPLRPKLGPTLKGDRVYDAWSSALVGDRLGGRRPGVNGGGVCISGLPDGGVAIDSSSPAGYREWTSPFAGKDLFSLSRQSVTSPSL